MRIRRWLYWLLTLALIWVVANHFSELQRLVRLLAQGQWQWILMAAGLQLAYYVIYTWLYQASFTTVGVALINKVGSP